VNLIGFVAPRSTGNNFNGNSSLSFEVVRIMLEHGMVHALLVAMHRVPLHHHLAPTTVGALMLPFEIMTRSSVGDVVKAIVEKEVASKEIKSTTKLAKQVESSDQGQSYDHMLEDAFAVDSSLGHRVSIESSFFPRRGRADGQRLRCTCR
jgi:hypothetical protein